METYYNKYLGYTNEIRNRLFQINQKRSALLQQLEYDYLAGLIDEFNYHKAKRLGILETLPYSLEKYSLTQEEIEYVKKYGKVINGELDIELINDYFIKKLDLIGSVCTSVIEGEKIYNMTTPELRTYLKERTMSQYEEQIKRCEHIIQERRTRLGNNAIYDTAYGQASHEKAKYESERMSLINYIETIKDEELYQYAYNSHKVNGTYYEWFKSKQSKKEQEEGTIYNKARNSITNTRTTSIDLYNSYQALENDNYVINTFIQDYLRFIELTNVNSLLRSNNIRLRNNIFMSKKKKEYIKIEYMRRIFEYILNKYNILKDYLIDTIGVPKYLNKQNRIVYDIDPNKYFNIYLNKEYRNLDKVTLIDFINDLIDNLKKYAGIKYQRLMSNRSINQTQYETIFNSLNRMIIDTEEYLSQEELLQIYQEPNNIILPRGYITEDEENEIYTNLEQVLQEQINERKRNKFGTLTLNKKSI